MGRRFGSLLHVSLWPLYSLLKSGNSGGHLRRVLCKCNAWMHAGTPEHCLSLHLLLLKMPVNIAFRIVSPQFSIAISCPFCFICELWRNQKTLCKNRSVRRKLWTAVSMDPTLQNLVFKLRLRVFLNIQDASLQWGNHDSCIFSSILGCLTICFDEYNYHGSRCSRVLWWDVFAVIRGR